MLVVDLKPVTSKHMHHYREQSGKILGLSGLLPKHYVFELSKSDQLVHYCDAH